MSGRLTAVFAFAVSVVVAQTSAAQSSPATIKWVDSVTKLIEAGMTTGQPSGLDQAIALLDRVLTVTPNDAIMLHYKGYALYRKANPMMEDETKKAEVKALLEAADDALESSAKTLQWPETYALRASVTGQMIGVGNPISGMVLGPKAENQIEKAVELGPNNPRVWMLKGVGNMFKPKMFGRWRRQSGEGTAQGHRVIRQRSSCVARSPVGLLRGVCLVRPSLCRAEQVCRGARRLSEGTRARSGKWLGDVRVAACAREEGALSE